MGKEWKLRSRNEFERMRKSRNEWKRNKIFWEVVGMNDKECSIVEYFWEEWKEMEESKREWERMERIEIFKFSNERAYPHLATIYLLKWKQVIY